MVRQMLRCKWVLAGLLMLGGGPAGAMGHILGASKEELGLRYEVEVTDHGTGRVTAVLTLSDEGRLKPLYEVRLVIPEEKEEPAGRYFMDLSVALDAKPTKDGKRVARVHLTRELAKRAEIWLSTRTLDGKQTPLTSHHHVIPIRDYLQ